MVFLLCKKYVFVFLEMYIEIFRSIILLCLWLVFKYFSIDKNKWSKYDKVLIFVKIKR